MREATSTTSGRDDGERSEADAGRDGVVGVDVGEHAAEHPEAEAHTADDGGHKLAGDRRPAAIAEGIAAPRTCTRKLAMDRCEA